MFSSFIPRASALVLILSIFAFSGFAQDLDDVTVSGKITDSNNLAVAGATVTATSIGTGEVRTVITNDDGRYTIVKLKPGVYKIKATATGFGPQETPEIITVSGQSVQKEFKLSPADVRAEQIVTVTADDQPLIDTTRIVVGGTITEREIEELPNNSRNALDLVLTLGGTTEEALSTRDLAEDRNSNARSTPLEQGNFSLSGGAAFSNNLTIDGLDNNDDRGARDRFQPSLESIAEVQVIKNQFSAEYGRASGGRVNIRTRAGGNKFRGRAFMFFKDEALNANSYYNNSRGFRRLPLQQINPGFTLSGPIVLPYIYDGHNRTFFFASYEHDKLADTTFIDTYIPVVANPRFDLPPPNGSGQFCDVAGSPVAPCPTGVGAVSGYSSLLDTPNRSNVFSARVDHRLFEGNDFTFGFQFGRRKNQRTSGAAVTRIDDALQARNINSEAFNFTDNQVFGASTVNQLRFQWSKYEPSYVSENPFDPVVLVSYRNPVTNGVQTLIAGNSTASNLQNFADSRTETRYQIQDSLTHVRGRSTYKMGADIHNVDSKATSLSDATGTYNFGSVFNYSANTLSRYRQNFGTASDVTNRYYGVFFNDELRATPHLTISAGLRYERETAIDDSNNFGPRVGVAWDPFHKGNDVLRFGAGLFYNRVLLRTVGDFIQNSLGGLQSFDSNSITTTNDARANVLASIAQDFPNGYASVDTLRTAIARASCGATTCAPGTGFLTNTGNSSNPLRSVDPNLRIPESYQFNVGYERDLGKGFVFEANYTYNKTLHLWREFNPNVPIVPAGFADLTAYLDATNFTFLNSNGTIRTYDFYRGPTTDIIGLSTSMTSQGTCSSTATVTCFVNLNTRNNSTTALSTNIGGVGVNSIGSPIGAALAAVQSLRPDPNFDEKERVSSIGRSDYHGLVMEIRSRFKRLGYGFGSSFRAVYTLSRLRDDGLNNTTNADINGDFNNEFTRATQDRRHRFALSGTVETPRWFGKLRLSPIFRYGSSAPFSLGTGADRNLNDVSTDRLLFSGNLNDIRFREPGTPFPQALFDQFSLLPIGASGAGNIPRNAGRGPSFYVFDMNVSREFRFTERYKLRPTIEFGNILNAKVFSYGSEFINFFGTPTTTQQASFLVPQRTYRPRDIRVGMRFDF
ncbi:MAG: carboxypeptidase regulatory-like domain-containing protein [Pyrinomonadaceae bacterium]